MRIGKHFLLAGIAALAFAASAQAPGVSKWQGVWKGQLDGQPGVILTLVDDDGGQVGGTAVFNMVMRSGGQPHVGGNSVHLLQHLQPADNSLAFEVKVARTSEPRDLHFTLQLTDENKAQLICTNCGSPATELVRSRYPAE
jgi:hypothetical protein